MPEMQRRRIRSPRHLQGTRRARIFYGCSRYPDCDFTTPHEPINEPCPKCAAPFIVEKRTKQGNFRSCIKEGCDWEIEAPATAEGATGATAAAPPVSTAAAPTVNFVHPQEPATVGARDKS